MSFGSLKKNKSPAANEIEQQYLSAEKARKALNWKPYYALDEGLTRTIARYRDFSPPVTQDGVLDER